MAQMAAAVRAVDLHARHALAAIQGRRTRSLERTKEARPAGAALEFRVGRKDRPSARRAGEGAVALLPIERARAGALGTMLPEHVVLLGREGLLPLLVGFLLRILAH